jgi:hypothetical protein
MQWTRAPYPERTATHAGGDEVLRIGVKYEPKKIGRDADGYEAATEFDPPSKTYELRHCKTGSSLLLVSTRFCLTCLCVTFHLPLARPVFFALGLCSVVDLLCRV